MGFSAVAVRLRYVGPLLRSPEKKRRAKETAGLECSPGRALSEVAVTACAPRVAPQLYLASFLGLLARFLVVPLTRAN